MITEIACVRDHTCCNKRIEAGTKASIIEVLYDGFGYKTYKIKIDNKEYLLPGLENWVKDIVEDLIVKGMEFKYIDKLRRLSAPLRREFYAKANTLDSSRSEYINELSRHIDSLFMKQALY